MADPVHGFHHDSAAGTAASLRRRSQEPLRVAPTTGSEFNVVELDLRPVACLALRDAVFAFDSSFIQPSTGSVPVATLLASLDPLRQRHKDAQGRLPLLSLFGHADPVGKDEYNKLLSGRRAKAVFGLLTHRVDVWQELHDHPQGGDDWRHNGADDTMRRTVGAATSVPRAQVFERYMKSLFPVALGKTEFLGRGQDAQGKADFQGCGELNPVLVFSQDQDREFNAPAKHAARNQANQPNRRVLLYLFPAALAPDPRRWPCPRAHESAAGCKARLFSDADRRRNPGPTERQFVRDEETFACRFYARIADDSPCEQGPTSTIRVRVEPAVFTRHGNVMASVQSLDGQPLPETGRMRLGGTRLEFVFAAPDGRRFFRPPVDGDATIADGVSGSVRLELDRPVTYTDDAAASARSLRQQMALLRDCAAQRVVRGRLDGETAAQVRSMHSIVIGDGHCRFADAMDRVLAARGAQPLVRRSLNEAPAAPTSDPVQRELDGFGEEHGGALDATAKALGR